MMAFVAVVCVFVVMMVGCGDEPENTSSSEELMRATSSELKVAENGLPSSVIGVDAAPAAPGAATLTAFHLNRSVRMRQDSWTDDRRVEVDVADVPFTEVHFSAKVVPPFTDAGATISVTFPNDVADDIALESNTVQVWANNRWTDLTVTNPSRTVVLITVSDLDTLVGDYVTAHTKIKIGNLPPGNQTIAVHNSSGAGYTSEYLFRVSAQSAFLLNSNYKGEGTWKNDLHLMVNVFGTTVDEIHFSPKLVNPFVDSEAMAAVTLPDGVTMPTAADNRVKVWYDNRWNDYAHSVSDQTISFGVSELTDVVTTPTARMKIIIGMPVLQSKRVSFENSTSGHTSQYLYVTTLLREPAVTAFRMNQREEFHPQKWFDWSTVQLDFNAPGVNEVRFLAKIGTPFTDADAEIEVIFPSSITVPATANVQVWYNGQWNDYDHTITGQTVSLSAAGLLAVVTDVSVAVVRVTGISITNDTDVTLKNTGGNEDYTSTYQFRLW